MLPPQDRYPGALLPAPALARTDVTPKRIDGNVFDIAAVQLDVVILGIVESEEKPGYS
jgi:hypothetical protein